MTTRAATEQVIPPESLTRGPSDGASVRRARRAGAAHPDADVDIPRLFRRLRRDVSGEVRFDDSARHLYAEDASNYRHVPLGVVVPRHVDDVLLTLAACREANAPVVSRTGGTALAGQAANEAVVVDFSKYMDHILELDPEARRARVEPGVVCDRLVEAARPHGLTWGPKPATHDHCCFGGMIANNCGGMHAQYAGIAVHNVEALDVVLYDGTRLSLGWLTLQEWERRALGGGREGEIFARLRELGMRHGEQIQRRFPRLPRRVSGYNLDELLPGADGRVNLARALVGSEGTCALTLAATLRLVDDPPERRVVALGYEDVYTAADHVPEVLGFEPLAVEGMDRVLYDHVRDKHLPQRKYLDLLPAGNGWLLVELGSHHRDELEGRARRLCETLLALPRPPRQASIIDARDAQAHLWKVREAGLGATAFVPGRPDAWPGFEDSAVPPERLGAYLRDLRALFERYDYHPALYGHFGAGCVHCRVNFDLTTQGGIARYRAFMRDAVELCAGKYGGSISGEHGDGQARGELLQQMFGDELVGAFREFKSIWDPDGKMNPGRVVDARPLDRDLRLGAGYAPWQPPTHFRFPDDGGSMAHATLRCVGVGKCRRQHGADADDDTMCPSFMVTHEEKHSTRGRAHLLWEMMRNGATATAESWQDEAVKDALELCLSCKGCKGDCPVNVDIATYKAEFLSHYHAGKLRPRHAYAFGLIDRWARLAALAPGWVNLVTQLPGLRSLARVAAGITPERALPRFAPQTFRAWFEQRAPSPQHGQRVLLWPDTFNNYFYPDTARAAVRVLEQLGFQVAIPREILCCGRPLYDYGFLVRAKRYLERVLAVLAPELEAGTPIVVLEPSCCAVFRDELPALLPERADARKLAEQALLLSELVARRGLDGLPQLNRTALVQGHCHHKAVMRFEDESAVLKALGLDAEVLASGCCGLAGSFGFERDKYAVSHACGERVLFPRVRDASDQALIIADGFSCRTQIEHGTGRRALHLAEVMALAIDVGPEGPPRSERPETAWMAERDRVARRSMWRAAIGSALVLGMLLLARRKPRGRWPSR